MLIVCPNCATSYMIDPATVGPGGRAVRCARCKSTWFATATRNAGDEAPPGSSNVSAFVDSVIAEAEAETGRTPQQTPPSAHDDQPEPPAADPPAAPAGKFPGEPFEDLDREPEPFEHATHNADLAPRDDDTAVFHSSLPEPEDHENVPMADAPSLVPPIDHESEHFADGHAALDPDEAESFVARRQRLKARRQKSKRMSRWTAVILVLFAFNVALIGARSEIVRYLPQTASLFAGIGLPVNLRNLQFEKVKIVKESSDGVNILIIEGRIVNMAGKPTEVPRLRFAARNAAGQPVYTWSALPSRSILGANESMEFNSRLAAPPADAVDVMVRFFTAQDAANGTAGAR